MLEAWAWRLLPPTRRFDWVLVVRVVELRMAAFELIFPDDRP
jgi:hypothetical protein